MTMQTRSGNSRTSRGPHIFTAFPKVRSVLPPAYQRIHKAWYMQNRLGASPASALSQRTEGWMHRQVAKDVNAGDANTSTLEIGAGTLNHLPYQPIGGQYDIVEPFSEFYQSSDLLVRINNIYEDIRDVPADRKYDRIISIATFEHVCDLPDLVARSGLLLKPDAHLRVAIPSEGSLFWTLGWKCTTGLEFKLKHGLNYGVLLKHEHVNTANEIREILTYFFEAVSCRAFGLSRRFSFYQFLVCSGPRVDRCSRVLVTS